MFSMHTTINKIIFTINGHSVPIEKLRKSYTHQKIEFTRSQHGEKVITTQCEMALTISQLDLSIKQKIFGQ